MNVTTPVKYLEESVITSMFTYGITPYYPLRRKTIESLLTKNGFTNLKFASDLGPNQITVVAEKSAANN